MNFSVAATADYVSNGELFLKIDFDGVLLEGLHPLITTFLGLDWELDRLALRHHDHAIHVVAVRVLELEMPDTAVADVKNASRHPIMLTLQKKQMSNQMETYRITCQFILNEHVIVLVEAGLWAELILFFLARLLLRLFFNFSIFGFFQYFGFLIQWNEIK